MPNIVKNTTFPSLLDLIAPYSCQGCHLVGQSLCDNCKNNIITHHTDHCPLCKTAKTSLYCPHCSDLPPTFTVDSRNHLLGNLVHDLKYDSVRPLARTIATIMHATAPDFSCFDFTNNHFLATPSSTIIVPLPTISRHIRERGLDHTHLIAKHFVRLRGHPYRLELLLIRQANTVQVGTDRQLRLAQASHAYAINPHHHIHPNSTYVLFDDVWTTGASLDAAYQVLRTAGASKIILFPLSYSE